MFCSKTKTTILREICQIIIFASSVLPPTTPQLVKLALKQGTISGFMDYSENRHGFYSFLGIPYAQPPVGDLRFKDPVPNEGWPGERLAREYGPACPQWDSATSTVVGNEDCLTLNVFTQRVIPPSFVGTVPQLPVMVWIHGGAFVKGSAALYGPAKLLSAPIVLVTLNYRLGALGFLSTEDEMAPGNYAMLDLILALTWVKDNIHIFGGDSHRVTIFGESAGAAAVSHLMISPLAKGLFWAAIAQSGSALCDWAVEEEPLDYAVRLASAVGCDVASSYNIVECLRQKSAAEVIEAQQLQLKYSNFFPLRTAPVIDRGYRKDPFLPGSPETLLRNGNFSTVPLIAGVVEHEGLLFLLRMFQEYADEIARDPRFLENVVLPEAVDAMTDQWYTPNKMNQIKNFYFKNVDFDNMEDVIPPFVDLLSDILFFSCNDKMVKLHSRFAPVYMYNLAYRGNYSYSDSLIAEAINMWKIESPLLYKGVSHVDDLLYLFNFPNLGPSRWAEDKRVQDIMVYLWTTFATQGTPNRLPQPELVYWQSLIESSLTYLNITPFPHVTRNFRQVQLSIYDYINLTPPAPEKYKETRESYYIATWVLVTLGIILLVACTALVALLIRASHKRTYSTSTNNLDSNSLSTGATISNLQPESK